MAVLSIGTIATNVSIAIIDLNVSHYDMRFVKPMDDILLHHILKTYTSIITIEDGTIKGAFGSAVLEFAAKHHYKNNMQLMGITDFFIEHGKISDLQEFAALDTASIRKKVLLLLKK